MISKLKEVFKSGKKEHFLLVHQYVENHEMMHPLEKEALRKSEIIALELEKQLNKQEDKYDRFRMNLGEGVLIELDKSTGKNIIQIKHYGNIVGEILM